MNIDSFVFWIIISIISAFFIIVNLFKVWRACFEEQQNADSDFGKKKNSIRYFILTLLFSLICVCSLFIAYHIRAN